MPCLSWWPPVTGVGHDSVGSVDGLGIPDSPYPYYWGQLICRGRIQALSLLRLLPARPVVQQVEEGQVSSMWVYTPLPELVKEVRQVSLPVCNSPASRFI